MRAVMKLTAAREAGAGAAGGACSGTSSGTCSEAATWLHAGDPNHHNFAASVLIQSRRFVSRLLRYAMPFQPHALDGRINRGRRRNVFKEHGTNIFAVFGQSRRFGGLRESHGG